MIHINRFIDKIKVAEARHSTNFIMPMRDATDLHADITKLLIALHEISNKKADEITEIVIKSEF